MGNFSGQSGNINNSAGPAKGGIRRFLNLYRGRFWRLTGLNFLFFIFNLPLIFYCYIQINVAAMQILGADFTDLLPGIGILAAPFAYLAYPVQLVLMAASALFFGPARLFMAFYIGKNCDEEYVRVADFFDGGVKKICRGIILGFLDIVVYAVSFISFLRLLPPYGQAPLINAFLRYASLAVAAFYSVMRIYMYLLAGRFGRGILESVKSGAIFLVVGFSRNILVLAILTAVFALSLFAMPLLTVAALPFFSFSLAAYAAVFIVIPVVKKYFSKGGSQGGGD